MGSRAAAAGGPRVNGQGFAMARRAALLVALTFTAAPAHGDGAPAAGGPAPAASAPTRAHVSFLIEAPATTPAGSTLCISGNASELGNWSGSGLKLVATKGRHYAATLDLAPGTSIEFKVTRGSWDTVEKSATGEEIANRQWTVQGDDTVRVSVAKWRDQTASRVTVRHSTRTGDVRVLSAFPSKFVKARDVLVWLPPGYANDPKRRYPVLYCHDGNNMLDDSTSFVGEWKLDETAARLIAEKRIEPFIAVCVYNTDARIAEYTPVADSGHGGGKGGDYARFIIEELKPAIDKNYRTAKSPARTGVLGSSLGGLISLAIGFDHPEVFGLVGAVSPSVWWADGAMIKRATEAPKSLRVWLDIGSAEGDSPLGASRTVHGVEATRDALLKAGLRDSQVHFEVIEGAHHNEAAWSARLDRILEFLLPAAR